MNNTTPIFFYGTLRAPEVRSHVLQEEASCLDLCEAFVIGFKLRKVFGATYPALAIDPDAKQAIVGLLANNLTKTMVKKIDVFEGQNYGRNPVTVTSNNGPVTGTAEAYLPKNLTNLYGKWNFEYWRRHQMSDFLASLQDNGQII